MESKRASRAGKSKVVMLFFILVCVCLFCFRTIASRFVFEKAVEHLTGAQISCGDCAFSIAPPRVQATDIRLQHARSLGPEGVVMISFFSAVLDMKALSAGRLHIPRAQLDIDECFIDEAGKPRDGFGSPVKTSFARPKSSTVFALPVAQIDELAVSLGTIRRRYRDDSGVKDHVTDVRFTARLANVKDLGKVLRFVMEPFGLGPEALGTQ